MVRDNVTQYGREELHERVLSGDILGAVKMEAARHGFKRFSIDPSYGETFSVGDVVRGTLEKDVLNIGPRSIERLRRFSRKDPELAEMRIEHKCAHEGGHTFAPKAPSKINGKTPPPWSADDIIASQVWIGMDPYGPDEVAQQESQANLYAAVKCHDGRTTNELKTVIAAQIWDNSVYQLYDELETGVLPSEREDAVLGIARYYATEFVGYHLWMKPAELDDVMKKVVEIDKSFYEKERQVE